MTMQRPISIAFLTFLLAFSGVGVAFAQSSSSYQYQSNGIFGCSNIGGASVSSGTFSAMGGVYVPVNDAAVTLNSGIQDYLQCVLRPLVSRLRESATASFTQKGVSGFLTGHNGNPLWPVDLNADIVAAGDKAALSQLLNIVYVHVSSLGFLLVGRFYCIAWVCIEIPLHHLIFFDVFDMRKHVIR